MFYPIYKPNGGGSRDWKDAVETFADIATTYPNPKDGWTVTVKDNDLSYRFNGTEWVPLPYNIPIADPITDGLMAKEDKIKLDSIEQKTINQLFEEIKTIDGVGSGLDADLLRGKTPSDFAPSIHDHDAKYPLKTDVDNALLQKQDRFSYVPEDKANKGIPDGYAGLDGGGKIPFSQLPNELVTSDELVDLGNGDMRRSIYDVNNNGVVDRAELAESVDWSGILNKPPTFVPAEHNHDILYYTKDQLASILGNKVNKFSGNIDSIENTVTILHNLDTLEVIVSVYEISTGRQVYLDVSIVDLKNVKISQIEPFGTNIYKIVVMG